MALPPMAMMTGGNKTMGMQPHRKRMMMHMTFYWGKDALILFTGWPGVDNLGMYVLALVFVFFLAVLVEWLAHCNVSMNTDDAASGLAQTLVYGLRVGLGFMVMLALMSFNVGVFLVAVLGHAMGFFFFRVVMRSSEKKLDEMSAAC